eukprot:3657876-Rhodomonas_salina.1
MVDSATLQVTDSSRRSGVSNDSMHAFCLTLLFCTDLRAIVSVQHFRQQPSRRDRIHDRAIGRAHTPVVG